MSAIPEGWKLVVVNQSFDDLMYWLGRCDEKGHLEQCPDLIDPWSRFDYRPATANLAAAQEEVARLRAAIQEIDVEALLDDAVNAESELFKLICAAAKL